MSKDYEEGSRLLDDSENESGCGRLFYVLLALTILFIVVSVWQVLASVR